MIKLNNPSINKRCISNYTIEALQNNKKDGLKNLSNDKKIVCFKQIRENAHLMTVSDITRIFGESDGFVITHINCKPKVKDTKEAAKEVWDFLGVKEV